MSKSPDAFRTIREVADWLGVAAHVLRFWESKFTQIKPVKRAGGRRYYRPADMELVGGIKVLLHDRGMTVRGVQRMLREEGVATVAALSPPLDAIAVPSELLEGIADEAAWHEDARAEGAQGEATPATPPSETVSVEVPAGVEDAEAASADEAEAADSATEAEHAAPSPPSPNVETSPAPEAETPVDAPAATEPSAAEPVSEPEAAAAPDRPADPDAQPALTDTSAPTAEQAETPGHGLDRLAAFVAVARELPEDNRPRLRPAIAALRRLKERMETPLDGTDG
jgi:DNA-binding transcriptional MerR regulator